MPAKANVQWQQKKINMFFFAAFTVSIYMVAVAATCDPEWGEFNGSCFKVFLSAPNPITLLAARRECGAVGADLASIHSKEENNFVKDLAKPAVAQLPSNYSTSNNSAVAVAFHIGLLLDRPESWLLYQNMEEWLADNLGAIWMDGSPVDFSNSMAGTGLWPQKPKANNIKIASVSDRGNNCVLLLVGGADPADGGWAALRCDSKRAVGFVCRKDPTNTNNTKNNKYGGGLLSALKDHPTCAVLSLLFCLVQGYVLWLVVAKTPAELRDYRFFLIANTLFDVLFTFALGILFSPDLWLPHALAGTACGLARFLGPYGGEIAICLAVCVCSSQVLFQTFALLYRFASVMEKRFPRLYQRLNQRRTRVAMLLFVLLYAPLLSLVMLKTMDDVQMIEQFITVLYDSTAVKSFSDAQLADLPVFMIKPYLIQFAIAFFGGGFMCIQLVCFLLSVQVGLYLRKNAKYFLERQTYKLQKQLILTLGLQLLLPLLFVGLPLLGTFVAWLFFPVPSKSAANFGILLFELYALSNPLTIVLLVSPYRRLMVKMLGLEWLSRWLWPRATEIVPLALAGR